MHDETFLVTQGTLRFHGKDGAIIDAHTGDYMTVPPRAPHTFVSFHSQNLSALYRQYRLKNMFSFLSQ